MEHALQLHPKANHYLSHLRAFWATGVAHACVCVCSEWTGKPSQIMRTQLPRIPGTKTAFGDFFGLAVGGLPLCTLHWVNARKMIDMRVKLQHPTCTCCYILGETKSDTLFAVQGQDMVLHMYYLCLLDLWSQHFRFPDSCHSSPLPGVLWHRNLRWLSALHTGLILRQTRHPQCWSH